MSSVGLTGGPNWWSWPLRLAVAGLLRRRPFCGCWCAPKTRSLPGPPSASSSSMAVQVELSVGVFRS